MKKKLLLQDISDLLVQPGHAGKKDADNFVRAFFDIVEQGLLEDQFVKIKGLGTFKLVSVSDRESVNINTGERFQISGHTKISFTPDNAMKELVNRPFSHFEAVDLSEDTDTAEFDLIDQEIARMEQEARTEEAETEPTQPEPETEAETEVPDSNTGDRAEAEAEAAVPDELAEEEDILPEETPTTGQPRSIVTPQSDDLPITASTEPTPEEQTEYKEGEEEEDAGQATTIIVPLTDDEPAAEIPEGNDAPADADDAAEETVPAQNEEEQDATEDSEALPAADEEIGVSAPRAITQTTDFTAQQQTDDSLTPANYTYCETPPRPRYKWLKRTAASAGILFLLVLCYFAGYYRLLCPCQLPCIPWFDEMPAVQPTVQPAAPEKDAQTKEQPAVPAVPPATKPEQPAPASTPAAQPAAQPQDGGKAKPEADSQKQAQAVSSAQQPAQQQGQTDGKQATAQQPAKPGAQASQDAKPRFHTVRKGENLTQISRRYYGSDRYIQKIIRKNNLSDANNIIPGTRLLLP